MYTGLGFAPTVIGFATTIILGLPFHGFHPTVTSQRCRHTFPPLSQPPPQVSERLGDARSDIPPPRKTWSLECSREGAKPHWKKLPHQPFLTCKGSMEDDPRSSFLILVQTPALSDRRPHSAPPPSHFDKLIERCSDGGEDQGAGKAFMGPRENRPVSFGSRLPCERLSFQRARLTPA